MADDRKAKLKALAARAGRVKEARNDVDDDNNNNDKGDGDEALVVPTTKKVVVFRIMHRMTNP